MALHFRAVTKGERGTPWKQFVKDVSDLPPDELWRHNQAGDLPGEGEDIDSEEMDALVRANVGRRGYTYTHKYNTLLNRDLIRRSNERGFTVNLSANSPAHADELSALDIGPVVTVLPTEQTTNLKTPAGRRIVVCPAATHDDVSCRTCGICQKPKRDAIVGFPAHGTRKKKASAVARGEAMAVRRLVGRLLA